MYVITGATSNTGSVVAHRLLDAGKQVRVIGRSLDRLKPFIEKGAFPFVTTPDDPEGLKKAFDGAHAAWIMLQPNYIADSNDFRGFQTGIIEGLISAITGSSLKFAVTLSSWGADKTHGTGPVLGLHDLEVAFNSIKDLNVLHLRAGYFMENTLSWINSIINEHKVLAPFDPELRIPFISTADIGNVAADALLDIKFKGNVVRELHGEKDLTFTEATAIVGKKIAMPGLIYQQISIDEFEDYLLSAGVSENVTGLMLEVVSGINSKHLTTSQQRTLLSTTPTSLEKFIDDKFLPIYRQSLPG